MTSGPGDDGHGGHLGYGGDHVEIHGTFHDQVIGKIGTYIENYHPPAAQEGQPQIVEGDIPRPPPGFQPRQELVEALAERVAAEGAAVVCALTGTPGVGKSVLAASYAWACQHARWPVVAWIASESEVQILTGLAALAERLGKRNADDDTYIAASRAKDWLAAADQPCLVIFDNAADPALVRRWCPSTGAARVVITSRNAAFSRIYAPVEVAAFTPDEARALLAERTGLTDEVGADRVAAELGRLPLALSQAAAVIAQRRIGYGDYLALLRDFPLADYLPAQAGEDYPAGTAQAMLLAIQQAESAIEEVSPVLGVLAVLSATGIARYLLYPTPTLDTDREVDRASRAKVDGLLAALADTSLITFTADGSTILMHRLVQRVLRERAQHDGHLGTLIDHATTLLAALNTMIPAGAATWSARTSVEVLHEQTTALHTHDRDLRSTGLLALRAWCGRYLRDLADLPRAIEMLTHVLTDCERLLGADHPNTLTIRSDLASTHEAAGRVAEAIALHEVTLAEQERLLGVNHLHTMASRNNLAGAYEAAGRVAEAIALFEVTLADRERLLGADHPDTLTSRNNLAHTYKSAGRVAEAIALFEVTLADRERVQGADHPDTLNNRSSLAGAYEAAGRVAEAIALHEVTLADRERLLGADHPHTMASRNNLAHTYDSVGRVAEAIALHEVTLADRERLLGADHLHTLLSRGNLASAYWSAGRVAEAIALFEVTLAEQERLLGADHLHTLASRGNLAHAYLSAGRVTEAIALHEVTLAEQERLLGADHPHTLTSRNNLAHAYGSVSRMAEAIALLEVTLADRERLLGADHPDTLTSRNNLAYAYGSVGRVAEAIALFEVTLADCERMLGADHPTTRTVRDNYMAAWAAANPRPSRQRHQFSVRRDEH